MLDKIRIQYVTTDGSIFDTSELAEKHQATLLTAEQQEKVKRAEKALDAYVSKHKSITFRELIRWLALNWESL